jgi:hypothetical protein
MHGRIIAASLALAGLAQAGPTTGYLAVIGPAALRFEPPIQWRRPPPPEPEPEPPTIAPTTNTVEAAAIPAVSNEFYGPEIPEQPPEPPNSLIEDGIPNFVSGIQPDSQYAPPSVLLRYFTAPGTNSPVQVVVPVGFQAPVAPAPFRSSATFEKEQ